MAKNGKLQLDYIAGEEGVMYIRVSTPDQEDGTSLETQREKNLALADVYSVVIRPDRIISEVWSAADPDRPGLRIVWDLVARPEVRHVFVYDTDRLARDPWHVAQFIRHCKDHGVTLHFADGTTVETILDEVIQYIRGFVGHQEREKIAERTMNGKLATAKANRMPNGCGRGLYGYDYDLNTHTRSINEGQAAVVRQMFDWRFIRGLLQRDHAPAEAGLASAPRPAVSGIPVLSTTSCEPRPSRGSSGGANTVTRRSTRRTAARNGG